MAIIGTSGALGQSLLRAIDLDDGIRAQIGDRRFVGIDVRPPPMRPRSMTFHLADISRAPLEQLLEDVEMIVHLAFVSDAAMDLAAAERVNIEGTRRLLAAASAMGVRKVVYASSATVYGATIDNPIPLTEDHPRRPERGFLLAEHKAAGEELVEEWRAQDPQRVGSMLRFAFVLGRRTSPLAAAYALGRLPVATRGASPPVQFLHERDASAALALAIDHDLDGVLNVAAPGWMDQETVRALVRPIRKPALRPDLAAYAARRLFASGVSDVPPGLLPYATYPWVIGIDRMVARGWNPRFSNEDALLAFLETTGRSTHGPGRALTMGAAALGAAGLAGIAIHRARR